jgi:fimbrial chaperone protein
MTPEGGLIKTEDPPWSVQSYVRYSPRRVTLEPAESQVIKIALRRQQDVAEGEYYSHFKILTLNSEDLIVDTKEPVEASKENSAVRIRARSAVAIPIIWRNSRTMPAATIESVGVDKENNQVNVEVRRDGKLSVRGYLHVVGTAPDGTRSALAEPMPLVIYPMLDRRVAAITLSEGITTDVLADNAEILYTTDLDVNSDETVLASYPIVP